jgi:hypothetical protein
MVDDWLIKSIWGDTPCGYSYRLSFGAFGGLVTVWDCSRVNVWSSMSFGNVLVIKRMVIPTVEEFVICNVYAPYDSVAKKQLWERLTPLVHNHRDTCVFLCGNFNAVINLEERKGRGLVFRQGDADMFNKFINDSFLIDLPICGRLFTWYRGDGVSMSRLDRFLLSNKLCDIGDNSLHII